MEIEVCCIENCNTKIFNKSLKLCRHHYRQLPRNKSKEREYQKKFRETEQGRKSILNYHLSEKGKKSVNKYHKTFKGRFTTSKLRAKDRQLDWTLSYEEYENFIKQTCFYCQNKISGTGTGLDRIDNSKGYIINNVLPCCGTCNRIRGDTVSVEEMIEIAKLLKRMRNT